MKPGKLEPLSSDVQSLLANERQLLPEPEELRARALARARAAMDENPIGGRVKARFRARSALLVAAVLGVAAVSAAAIEARRHSLAAPTEAPRRTPAEPTPPVSQPELDHRPTATPETRAPEIEPVEDTARPRETTRNRTNPKATSTDAREAASSAQYARELEVLQPARAAVARARFAAALEAIAEHERRFPNGQLGEEREALRVRALFGLHGAEEARGAAESFRRRFPRSVLLAGMKQIRDAKP